MYAIKIVIYISSEKKIIVVSTMILIVNKRVAHLCNCHGRINKPRRMESVTNKLTHLVSRDKPAINRNQVLLQYSILKMQYTYNHQMLEIIHLAKDPLFSYLATPLILHDGDNVWSLITSVVQYAVYEGHGDLNASKAKHRFRLFRTLRNFEIGHLEKCETLQSTKYRTNYKDKIDGRKTVFQ